MLKVWITIFRQQYFFNLPEQLYCQIYMMKKSVKFSYISEHISQTVANMLLFNTVELKGKSTVELYYSG